MQAPLLVLPLGDADAGPPAAAVEEAEDVERTSLWGEGAAPPGPGPDDEDESEGVTVAVLPLWAIEQTLECWWRSSTVATTRSPQRTQSVIVPGSHVWTTLQSLLELTDECGAMCKKMRVWRG